MAELTDPTPAMISFQEAIQRRYIPYQKAALDKNVIVHADQTPNGMARFAYATLQGTTVLAFANFVAASFKEGLPVFQVGVAVPEPERRKGRGKHVVCAGIAELKHGLKRAIPGAEFYVEAVVGLDNIASQQIMKAAFPGESRETIVDSVSDLPAFHYIRKF